MTEPVRPTISAADSAPGQPPVASGTLDAVPAGVISSEKLNAIPALVEQQAPRGVIGEVEDYLRSSHLLPRPRGEVKEFVKVEGDSVTSHAVVGDGLASDQATVQAIARDIQIAEQGDTENGGIWAAGIRAFSALKENLKRSRLKPITQ